ncbi:RAD50-interacting protein 1 [Taenia crassiceps]|uniref:RAD50-interacting protein 1 n=1 Tax=Taenia crassiceps TaxID=6207 RepID=A0ABR4Q6W2_9CEST
MGDTCTDTLNKVLQPSSNVKLKLSSLINVNEQHISNLKEIISFGESAEVLSAFSCHSEHFLKETGKIQQQLAILEPNVVSSLQAGNDFAEKIIPGVLQLKSLQASLSVAERDEAIARYRSEVAAAQVLGSLDMSLDSFLNLSLHLGTHISSSLPVLLPLPPFYGSMLEYFTNIFQETLNRMEIPKIRAVSNWMEHGASRTGDRCPWDENVLKTFRSLFQTLSKIELPEGAAETDAAKRAKLSIPVRLILEPLEKRFLFNFYGDRITNKPEKPEWYFTEVLTWITANDQWLTWMQDEQLKDLAKTSNLRVDFMQGLISFVVDKISFDLGLLKNPPKPRCAIHFKEPDRIEMTAADSVGLTTGLLTSPPPFFGHLTDEMLAFERCLEGLCYHPRALRPADLFTHRFDVLQHWITLESDLAHRKLKDLLAKPYAWRVDNKVPQCVGDFVTLVFSISRRAVHLHHNAAKSRAFFFKVQLDLIFAFLEAMITALPWNTKAAAAPTTLKGVDVESRDQLTRWTSILNALQTVLETMQEWTNDQYFLELWEDPDSHRLLTCAWDPWMDEEVEPGNEGRNGWKTITRRLGAALIETNLSEAAKTTTLVKRLMQFPGIFSEISELYERRIEESLQRVGQSLFGRLRELAQAYFSDSKQWSRVNGHEMVLTTTPPLSAIGLSGHATEMFVRLNYDLSATVKTLLPCLFTTLWQPVLRKLNKLLYKKLVLENHFTPVGANQLHYDLNNCLRALLMPYSNLLAVDDLLAECFDSCRLLSLPPGSIHLLKQSLLSTDTSSAILGPLVELGIHHLTLDDAVAVLSRYIPLTSSRGDDDGHNPIVLFLLPIKAVSEPGDFDTNALRDLAKEHQRRVRQNQAGLETYELRVLDSVLELASQLSLNLNEKVSKAYDNQCRLNTEMKRLRCNIQTFSRQVDLWNKEIFDISSALKELGDAETWSQKLCRDVEIIHNTLESVDR